MSEIDLTHLDLNLLVTFEVLMTEGSVTRAAARLRRTQSAISHSLARLREQVGDPLMVKVGGGMAPSPFAQKLIEEVRPILRSIQRVIAPPEPFDPATSDRVFRVAVTDITPSVLADAMTRIRREAPRVRVDWVTPGAQTLLEIADGRLDAALAIATASPPEGVEQKSAGAMHVQTFARRDHPAIASWGPAAWVRWPHIQVLTGVERKTGMERALEKTGLKRVVGARVPQFSYVPELVARTDLLATLPLFLTDEGLERLGLRVLEPPIPIDPVHLSFFWSFRVTSDPGNRWIRAILEETFADTKRLRARPRAKAVKWRRRER